MSAASTEPGRGVFFQPGAGAVVVGGPGGPQPNAAALLGVHGVGCGVEVVPGADPAAAARRQGKVTVKYDRKELRKRLNLEEWIITQLAELYDCEEEEMPEVEIDIDDLLEVNNEDERASKLQESLTDCYKPTEVFVRDLLERIRGMRKLSAPSKKNL